MCGLKMMQAVGVASPVRNDNGVIHNPSMQYNPDPRGLGCALFDTMVENSEFIAQMDGITGEEDSFKSLLQRCIRTAITLRSRGITPNDVVTICSYNHLNSCVPYLASLFLGVKAACLDPTFCLPDTIHLLKQTRPRIIFVGPEALQLIEDSLRVAEIDSVIVVFGNSTTYCSFSEYLEPSPNEDNFVPTAAAVLTDTATILFTGGTTGTPKAVCLSHRSLLCQIFYLRYYEHRSKYVPPLEYFQFQISFSSFYWISSLSILLYNIFCRRTGIICPKFDVDRFWKLIEKTKVNLCYLAPSQVQRICNKEKPQNVDLSSLRHVVITGSPLSKQLIECFKELLPGVKIINLYAIAEAGGYATSFRPHLFLEDAVLLDKKPNSCGRPRPGMAFKVVDNETGELLGQYQKGELRIKTYFEMNGYYNTDSSNCWDDGGWLKTGDVAYYDEDNCFYVVDRIQDMFRFKSWYVAPARLEAILHSHPEVEAAVVVGLPHPEDGEHPVGVVMLKASAPNTMTAKDIEDFVEHMVSDKYRLRGGVRIVENIPFTSLGTARRKDIRELLLRGDI